MSAVAVTPGAVAKIRESKIVTDELNVQVRSFLYSLSFQLSLSLSVCVCLLIRIEGSFQTFSLSGISQKFFCRFENFLPRFKKKDSN